MLCTCCILELYVADVHRGKGPSRRPVKQRRVHEYSEESGAGDTLFCLNSSDSDCKERSVDAAALGAGRAQPSACVSSVTGFPTASYPTTVPSFVRTRDSEFHDYEWTETNAQDATSEHFKCAAAREESASGSGRWLRPQLDPRAMQRAVGDALVTHRLLVERSPAHSRFELRVTSESRCSSVVCISSFLFSSR